MHGTVYPEDGILKHELDIEMLYKHDYWAYRHAVYAALFTAVIKPEDLYDPRVGKQYVKQNADVAYISSQMCW